MGGLGSGRWGWHRKKDTVESCYSLDASWWQREGILQANVWTQGARVWKNTYTGEKESAIGYVVNTSDTDGWLELKYTITATREDLDYTVWLQTTRPYFGGLRWWFTCPLVVNGVACRRRVRKLYLKGKYFGCRICYDLTYESVQKHDKRMDFYRKHPELIRELLDDPHKDVSKTLLAIRAMRW